eukprot:159863_1
MDAHPEEKQKQRPDYSYKCYDKQIKNATKPIKSHAIYLSTPYDTPLKLYMDNGYKPKPLKDHEIKILTVYGYDLNKQQIPIIDVEALIIESKKIRIWIPKKDISYTDWAPSIPKNLLSKVYKIGITTPEELNYIKLPRNYYPKIVKNNIVYNQQIGFDNEGFHPLEREKVRVLEVIPSQYIGVFGPEFRVYSYKQRKQYYCNQILLLSQKDAEINLMNIAINDKIDFMDFLYFAALHSAIESGADVSKVIETHLLPKYLDISSVWFNKISDYVSQQSFAVNSQINDDLCIYYLASVVRKAIDKRPLSTLLPQQFSISSSLQNIITFGLIVPPVVSEAIIKYCKQKEMNITSNEKELIVTVMTSNPNHLQHFNMESKIKYNGYTKIILEPCCILKYIRKYDAFLVSSITLRQSRN